MRPFSVRREVTLGLTVYALYLLVSRLVLRRDGRSRARRNAERIVALESRMGLGVEPAVQEALLRFPRLVHGLNVGYGLFNVTLTVGWLVFLYRRRDESYHRFRRTCLLAHIGAQPVFFLFPTAPPRVLDGFVDTLADVSGLDLEHPFLVRFYNPIAAMPSLHVAFAVVTGARDRRPIELDGGEGDRTRVRPARHDGGGRNREPLRPRRGRRRGAGGGRALGELLTVPGTEWSQE